MELECSFFVFGQLHSNFLNLSQMIISERHIEDCMETYLHRTGTTSQIIYWIVLASVAVAILALPFMYIDISVQGNGIIRPVAEKTEIKSVLTELVDSVYLHEGEKVRKGDVILRFRSANSDYEIDYRKNRLNDYDNQLADLAMLANGKCPSAFRSHVRRQEYVCFEKKKKEMNTNLLQAEKEYVRNKKLFDMKVISEEEYDNAYFHYRILQDELDAYTENQLSAWQADLNECRHLYNETRTALKQASEDKECHVVRSPVSGTIDQFSGIYKGSNVRAGQSLAVISPDSALCMEVYVSPRNIGFIHTGMDVHIQVESFDYHEWGTVMGTVREISSDFLMSDDGKVFYKIKCDMERNHLRMKDGRIGLLKKGMTANVRFMITRRSAFHLLYQKLDNWMNPVCYQDDNLITCR